MKSKAQNNAARMQRYHENKRNGLCDRCFSSPSRPNKTMCQECATKHQAVYREHVWKKKGLLFRNTDYLRLLETQGGGCAICDCKPKPGVKRSNEVRLHVDHDHTTLEVRGLLCGRCNRGIGMFDDSSEKMQKAARYVALTRAKSNLVMVHGQHAGA
jgi:hypothetical protein